MIAVVTADFIDSSTYSTSFMDRVLNIVQKEFLNFEQSYGEPSKNFKIYRGDSLQGIIKKPEQALFIALLLKTAVNKIATEENSNIRADLKIAIGIGSYDLQRKEISESNGEAFQFSGRSLDSIKSTSRKLILKTSDKDLNAEFETSLALFDFISDRWSAAAAEVIYYQLQGLKEKEIAQRVGVSQSAINQRKKAAGWEPISILIDRFHQKIASTF